MKYFNQEGFETFSKALYRLARPYLTVLIATMFNVVCAWAWFRGDMAAMDYVTAVGPTNCMIIGFWFGERAAQNAIGNGAATESA
jgi:hypothetical protein